MPARTAGRTGQPTSRRADEEEKHGAGRQDRDRRPSALAGSPESPGHDERGRDQSAEEGDRTDNVDVCRRRDVPGKRVRCARRESERGRRREDAGDEQPGPGNANRDRGPDRPDTARQDAAKSDGEREDGDARHDEARRLDPAAIPEAEVADLVAERLVAWPDHSENNEDGHEQDRADQAAPEQ